MTPPLLQAHHLYLDLTRPDTSEPRCVLADINLTLSEGGTLTVHGPTGSGKTSLLALLGILHTATSGTLLLRGQDITHGGEHDRNRLRANAFGYQFATPHLLDHLDVRENIALPLRLRPGLDLAARTARIDHLLHETDLAASQHHLPPQLPGHLQQRVALARALITRPAVLLLDEPTAGLDQAAREEHLRLIKTLTAGTSTAILIATSDAALARHGDQHLYLHHGTLCPEPPPETW